MGHAERFCNRGFLLPFFAKIHIVSKEACDSGAWVNKASYLLFNHFRAKAIYS
jgi:hypothetical protein